MESDAIESHRYFFLTVDGIDFRIPASVFATQRKETRTQGLCAYANSPKHVSIRLIVKAIV